MNLKLQFLAVIIIFTLSANAQVSENEKAARQWIKLHSSELKIKDTDTFKLSFVRKSLSGETLRFQQLVNDVPVFQSEIVVHFSLSNEITFSSDSYVDKMTTINTSPSIAKESAITISNEVLNITGNLTYQECKLFVYTKLPETKLVYRVVTKSDNMTGNWETIVDAHSGVVLSAQDIARYHHKVDPNKKKKNNTPESVKPISAVRATNFVSGTALVYDADPLSVAQVTYGGNYSSPASGAYPKDTDATNTFLNSARSSVVLPEIENLSGVYKLKGSLVEIRNLEAPVKGLFTQATSAFNFTRLEDGFEAVNAYYHLDKSLRYINTTLGITCKPYTNSGVLYYDPSAANGDDQSYYSNGALYFGEGGVDDAEDADVILHEMGHGIQDWITNGNDSQVNGLGEGIGDYWAVSYSRSLNQWPSTAEEYNWVFNWDGHNEWWDGRVVNTTKLYPSGLDGEVHDDGEIWAAASMQVYDAIGKTKSDTAFLEGIANTTSTTNQQNAARAVRQAAIDLNYPCTNIQAMTAIYTARGYSMPTIPLTMATIPNQTVQADVNNTYTLPSYATLANPITANCNATSTQSPAIGVALAPGNYTITITATSGSSSVVRTFTLTITANLGIEDATKNNFVLYPNPANNVVNIKGEFDSNETITIYNMLGQVVLKKAVILNEEAIDITTLATGVYTMSFNNAKVSRKFVKN